MISVNARKCLVALEACWYLVYYRLINYTEKAHQVLQARQTGQYEHLPRTAVAHTPKAKSISSIISKLSRWMPGHYPCIVQSLTAQRMLMKRDIPSTLYVGVSQSDSALKAHAWVRVGSCIVLGAEGYQAFTVVGCFSV